MEAVHVEKFVQAQDFLDALVAWNDRWRGSTSWFFRGQQDSEWQLTPSAFRPSTSFYIGGNRSYAMQPSHELQIRQAAVMMRVFAQKADAHGLPLPSEGGYHFRNWAHVWLTIDEYLRNPDEVQWPPPDAISLFALAQHYGVPTRLLDWTRSSLIAAYFAAREAAQYVHATGDNSRSLAVWAYNAEAGRRLLGDSIYAVSIIEPPKATNNNLRAQDGVFTLIRKQGTERNDEPTLPDLDVVISQHASTLEPQEVQRIALPVMMRLEVPHSLAGTILRLLDLNRISATHLFPGYEGVVRGMKEEGLWDISHWPSKY